MSKKTKILKLTKRPAKTAHEFGVELKGKEYDCAEHSVALLSTAVVINAKKKKMKNRRFAWLGFAMIAILREADRRSLILSFDTMDRFIKLERRSVFAWAIGIFCSAYARWCTNVLAFAEPDNGVAQQMLQLQLNAIGLIAYKLKLDPVVDCLIPIYEHIQTTSPIRSK